MKFSAVLKVVAAALATGALLVPSVGPAQAATYPPAVSELHVTPYLSGGYAAVSVGGQYLSSGLRVKATYGSRYTTAAVSAAPSGLNGVALVKVSSVIPTTAGRYTVNFKLEGTGLTGGPLTASQTYTIGKQISIKSFSVVRKSYGLYISGYVAKSTPVKITIKFGSRTYTKTVKSSSSTGKFIYRFYKTSKGTYTVTAKVAPNTKYFSAAVTKTYVRR